MRWNDARCESNQTGTPLAVYVGPSARGTELFGFGEGFEGTKATQGTFATIPAVRWSFGP